MKKQYSLPRITIKRTRASFFGSARVLTYKRLLSIGNCVSCIVAPPCGDVIADGGY